MFSETDSPLFKSKTVPFCARMEPGSCKKYGKNTLTSSLAVRVTVTHSPAGMIEGETFRLSSDMDSAPPSSPKQPESDASDITMTIIKARAASMYCPTHIILLNDMVEISFPVYGMYFPHLG